MSIAEICLSAHFLAILKSKNSILLTMVQVSLLWKPRSEPSFYTCTLSACSALLH